MNKYEIYNMESGYLISIDDEVTLYDFYDVPKQIVNIIKQLEQENKQLKKQLELEIKVRDEIHNYLHNKIDKAIDVIHTQMKNNPSYKENLKIIEITLIKGSCKVCDLKESDIDECK